VVCHRIHRGCLEICSGEAGRRYYPENETAPYKEVVGDNYSERHKEGVMRGAGRCSLRAATPPTGGVNAPRGVKASNDVKHGKAGTEAEKGDHPLRGDLPWRVREAFLGGCPGRL